MKTQLFSKTRNIRFFRSLFTLMMILWMGTHLSAQVQGTKLKGKVIQDDKGVSGATVYFQIDGKIVNAIRTDADGNYQLDNPVPGEFSILIKNEDGEEFERGKYTIVNGKSERMSWTIGYMQGVEEIRPTIEFHVDKVISSVPISRGNYLETGIRNPIEAALAFTSDITGDPRTGLSVRGSRTGATAYYVDGVKTFGNPSLPAFSINEIQVITGGIPAEYGDLIGGVISIQTINPGMYISRNAYIPRVKKMKKNNRKDNGKTELMQDNTLYWVEAGHALPLPIPGYL